MKKIAIVLALIAPLAACSETQKGAAVGAGAGALIGGLASGSWEGAAIGAAAGGAGGALVGRAREPGKCIYRHRGREYVSDCRR